MPNPIDLALTSLLPHLSFPPEQLQRLASSLLTQSRVRAPRLKPDEEVARTFACAHLACERLQHRLGLEIGRDVRPPCPPRVYTRLKGFLSGTLGVTTLSPAAAATTTTTPQTRRPQPPARGTRTRAGDEVGTPTSRKLVNDGASTRANSARGSAGTKVERATAAEATTPTSGMKRGRAEAEMDEAEGEGIPAVVAPLLVHVCEDCGFPAATASWVRAGAGEVLVEIASRRTPGADGSSSAKRRKGRATPRSTTKTDASLTPQKGAVPLSRWPALVLALFLCAAAKLRGYDVEGGEIRDLRKKAVRSVGGFFAENEASVPEGLDLQLGNLDRMVAFYLLEAGDCAWLEMGWYQNIPFPVDEENEQIMEDEGEETPVKSKAKPAKTPLRRKEKHGDYNDMDGSVGLAGLLPGLGTMFQPAVDWLSSDRRADFVEWKQNILGQIAALEQAA